jgi:hypothetical protein
MAGASILHGAEGYGYSGKIHHAPVWSLVDRAPIIVLIVDTADRIEAFIAANYELFAECVATVSDLRLLARPGGLHHPSRQSR